MRVLDLEEVAKLFEYYSSLDINSNIQAQAWAQEFPWLRSIATRIEELDVTPAYWLCNLLIKPAGTFSRMHIEIHDTIPLNENIKNDLKKRRIRFKEGEPRLRIMTVTDLDFDNRTMSKAEIVNVEFIGIKKSLVLKNETLLMKVVDYFDKCVLLVCEKLMEITGFSVTDASAGI